MHDGVPRVPVLRQPTVLQGKQCCGEGEETSSKNEGKEPDAEDYWKQGLKMHMSRLTIDNSGHVLDISLLASS